MSTPSNATSTDGIRITRNSSGGSDSSGMGSFVDAEKEFDDISKQVHPSNAATSQNDTKTEWELISKEGETQNTAAHKNDTKEELDVISKQLDPNNAAGTTAPPKKKKKKKKRSPSTTRDGKRSSSTTKERKRSESTNREGKRSSSTTKERKRSESTTKERKRSESTTKERKRSESTSRKENISVNGRIASNASVLTNTTTESQATSVHKNIASISSNTSLVTNTTTESQATIVHKNGAHTERRGDVLISKYKNIEGLLKKKGDQEAKERSSATLLADPDKAKKASDIIHNALKRSGSLTLTESKDERRSEANPTKHTAETENSTEKKGSTTTDNYDPFKISNSSEPTKKKKKKKKKRVALPPTSPTPFFSSQQGETRIEEDIELKQLGKPPKPVIKNGRTEEETKRKEKTYNTVRFEEEGVHPERKAKREVMKPFLAGKKFNLARSVITGVAALVFGLMLSLFAETTCSFITYEQTVGYYSEAFDIHIGMWEHAPIGNAFTNYASCVSYADNYSQIKPPTVSRSSGILAIMTGGFSLSVLWSYLLFLRFNALFWKIAVYSAVIAAVFQSFTLGVFFHEVCSENVCDAGPGSLSSVISTIVWAYLAREMHDNHPMIRTVRAIDSSKSFNKKYDAPELV